MVMRKLKCEDCGTLQFVITIKDKRVVIKHVKPGTRALCKGSERELLQKAGG